MDVMLNMPNSSLIIESEDEKLCVANEILQKLIADVEELLKNPNSSNEQYNPKAKDEQINHEDHEENLLVITRYKGGSPSCQRVHSCRKEEMNDKDYEEDFVRSGECIAGCNCEKIDLDKKVAQKYKINKDDLIENIENRADSSLGQSNLTINEEESSHEKNHDSEELNEHLEPVETDQFIDVVGSNSAREMSSVSECVSTDGTHSSTGSWFSRRTESSSEEILSVETFDSSDESEEFVEVVPAEEIGDQEEVGDLDEVPFLQRIIRYIRDTDMLLMANRGAGDVIADIDDDSDDDVIV